MASGTVYHHTNMLLLILLSDDELLEGIARDGTMD